MLEGLLPAAVFKELEIRSDLLANCGRTSEAAELGKGLLREISKFGVLAADGKVQREGLGLRKRATGESGPDRCWVVRRQPTKTYQK